MAGKTPTKSYRTFVLLLLTLVYGFNFIDRQIVGILAPFIQADLNLTNTQLGLLIGLAFAAFYTIMGIPIAIIADKYNRVNLLAISLAIWSGFTAMTGFAQNFLHIALARVGVGIGEAGGSPPSHSMISDFYSKEKRAGALGVYSLGIPLGIMSAYFITAWIVGADPKSVNWRQVFIMLGVAGVILAVIVRIVVREPVRGATEEKVVKKSQYVSLSKGMAESVMLPRYIFAGGYAALILAGLALGTFHWVVALGLAFFGCMIFWLSVQPGVKTIAKIRSWWWMCFGIAFASFAAYAFSGFQTKFLLQLAPEQNFQRTLLWIGLISGVFYVAGTFFGAKLVDIRARTSVRAYGYIPAISIILALPLGIASFWVTDVNHHLLLSAPFQVLIGVYLGPSFAIAQTLAPVHIRAMSTALFFFILNMIALGGGPTTAGILIDVFKDAHGSLDATRIALSIVCGAFVLAIISYLMVCKTLPKDWADAEARNTKTADTFD